MYEGRILNFKRNSCGVGCLYNKTQELAVCICKENIRDHTKKRMSPTHADWNFYGHYPNWPITSTADD